MRAITCFFTQRLPDLRIGCLVLLALGILWGDVQGASAQESRAAFRPDDTMAGFVGGYVTTDPASAGYISLAFTFEGKYDLGLLYTESSASSSFGAAGGILVTDPDSSLINVRAGGSLQSVTFSLSDDGDDNTTALVPSVSLTTTLPLRAESGALFAPTVAFSFSVTPSLQRRGFGDDLYVEGRAPLTGVAAGAGLGYAGSFGLVLVEPYYSYTFSYDDTGNGFGISLSLLAQLE